MSSFSFSPLCAIPFSEFKNRIASQEWVTQAFAATPLYLSIPMRAGIEGVPSEQITWGANLGVYQDAFCSYLQSVSGDLASFQRMVRIQCERPQWWEEQKRVWMEREARFENVLRTYFGANLRDWSVERLEQEASALFAEAHALECWSVRHDEVILGTDRLVMETTERDPELSALFRELLLSPETNYLQQEEMDLCALGAQGVTNTTLAEHAKRYGWIRSTYVGPSSLSVEDFRKRLVEIGGASHVCLEYAARLQAFVAEIQKKQEVLWPKVQQRVSTETFAALKLGNLLARWREPRKRLNLMYIAALEPFVCAVAERHGRDPMDAKYLVAEEFLRAFRDVEMFTIGSRRRLQGGVALVSALLPEGGWGEGVYEGEELAFVKEVYERAATPEVGVDIRGIPAASGVVEGNAWVVKTFEHAGPAPEHPVLITSMTRPEFVPLMKKAVAIVTDEGGMLSHAAIVSRELGIPCVVGTKYATRSLKNGERVVVDGDRGMVHVSTSKVR